MAYNNRMSVSKDILAQFNKLEKSGALDTLADLRKENRELDKIIIDASLLVAYTDVSSMLDFMIMKLLDHFIPQFLAFMVHPPRGRKLIQYCYRNLKDSNETIPSFYYEILRERFSKNPAKATFAELADELGPEVFTADFRVLEPEIIFPMFGIGGLYGIVVLGKKIIGTKYSDVEQKYVDQMIKFLSVSMQNGLHYESSITDPKTGLYTHDYFIRRTDEALGLAERRKAHSGILMMDVDLFKKFNDTWGHLAGDTVLLALAQVIKQTTRPEDCAARFGGEEFSILVADCTPYTLMQIADRVRVAISEIRLFEGNDMLSITVSIGARMIEAAQGINSLILLGDADKALYRSKKSGRNRCTLFAQGLLERAIFLRGETLPMLPAAEDMEQSGAQVDKTPALSLINNGALSGLFPENFHT